MPFFGCGPTIPSITRARCGTLILSAFFLACAFSITRAQAPAKDQATASEAASVTEAHGLVLRRAPGAKARVRALLAGEKDAPARVKLTAALGALPSKDQSPADFDEALADADASVRSTAVTSVGKLSGAAAESRLVKALEDPNPGVRMNAAFWLGQTSHRGAAAALGKALAGDSNANVRLAAAQALTRLNSAAARRELRRGAGDADERVRRWAK